MQRLIAWLLRFMAHWFLWAGIELARLANHLDSRQSRSRTVIIREGKRRDGYYRDHLGR